MDGRIPGMRHDCRHVGHRYTGKNDLRQSPSLYILDWGFIKSLQKMDCEVTFKFVWQGTIKVGGLGKMWHMSEQGGRIKFFK